MKTFLSRGLSRRAFLRGTGACVALPFLPSLARRAYAAEATFPRRFIAFYVPNGFHMPGWIPATTGPNYELPSLFQPLAALKSDFSILSGLNAHPGKADGNGDHASGTGAFLTSTHVTKSAIDVRAGISMDQVLANRQIEFTPFRSLQVGMEGGGNEGSCDSGYACAYTRNISWASATQPLPKVINPRVLFDLLFPTTPENAEKTRKRRHSVLDFVKAQAYDLEARLSRVDRFKLDEYMSGLRELEVRIDNDGSMCAASMTRPETDIDVPTRVRLMMDLMVLAVQCDLTRVLTFMLGNGQSYRSYGFIGIPEAHHDLSHHMGNVETQEKIQKINLWEMEQVAYFLGRLKALPEGTGSLLDNTTFYLSSEIADGNSHFHTDIPVMIAGRGGGRITSGTHTRYNGDPVANLFMTFLAAHDVAVDTFGDDGTALLPGILSQS
jgi:hypothetical protein